MYVAGQIRFQANAFRLDHVDYDEIMGYYYDHFVNLQLIHLENPPQY